MERSAPWSLLPWSLLPGPGPTEAGQLRFILPWPGLGWRWATAAGLFAAGLAVLMLAPLAGAVLVGLPLILAGHLPLWVRGLTTAPGGATPRHEEIWAPVDPDWLERLRALESRGRRWDASPWDLTSGVGCATLAGGLALVGALAAALAIWLGFEPGLRFALAGTALVAPQWLNGIRTTWNPSELRLKGEALAVARRRAAALSGGSLEPVDLLALREGRRGRYPVDARLMLRPAAGGPEGFLGVQVQVALNNVRGSDYPYLYCVILGSAGFALPPAAPPPRPAPPGLRLVWERGAGSGAEFLVVRQHADRSGGWHTDPQRIRVLVGVAVGLAREIMAGGRGGEVEG